MELWLQSEGFVAPLSSKAFMVRMSPALALARSDDPPSPLVTACMRFAAHPET